MSYLRERLEELRDTPSAAPADASIQKEPKMLHDSASRPDDDDVDEDDIDDEAGFQAAARLGAQLELFPIDATPHRHDRYN